MNVALIGYGEVGRILAEDLRAVGHVVTAFDLKLRGAAGAPMRAHALAHRVTLAASHAGAARQAEIVVSAVTASQTVAAAQACAAEFPAASSISIRPRRAPRSPPPSRSSAAAAATWRAR
jgi:3-hydroxyisobutyrate dehydrogenase